MYMRTGLGLPLQVLILSLLYQDKSSKAIVDLYTLMEVDALEFFCLVTYVYEAKI